MPTRREFLRDTMSVSASLLIPAISSAESVNENVPIQSPKRPNIILMLADDMGFSDLGCYGSEIETPNLDKLAAGGIRLTQFYNNPRCSPSRASLMTGLYPHQTGFGLLADNFGQYPYPGYSGDLSTNCMTIAEALKLGGYQTGMCGKWHLTPPKMESKHNWPCQRGFEKFYGTIVGANSYFDPITLCRDNQHIRAAEDNYYYTDAIGDNAVEFIDEFAKKDAPFFLYTAFTASHWPLHAPEKTISKYQEHYRIGWDGVRRERHRRQIEMGIVQSDWEMSPRDPRVPEWELAPFQDWEMRRMAVYAAQVDCLDQNVGKIVAKLEQLGIENDTLIFFLSDNGGNYEEQSKSSGYTIAQPQQTRDGRLVRVGNDPSIMPGGDDTFQSYGVPWGNVSNTPFRLYKHFAHEGGISTPLIVRWPAGLKQRNSLTSAIGHETDIMATCIDVAGVQYPATHDGKPILPLEGMTLTPLFHGEQCNRGPIFWEHEGNSAMRDGKWKLVSAFPYSWELHDMEADRTEMHDIAGENIPRVKEMIAAYHDWANRVGALPWPLTHPETPPAAPSDTQSGVQPYLERRHTE